jgi:S1-C subfamily serine protease
LCGAVLVALFALTMAPAARAQSQALTELLSGVVHMKTFINPDGRTTQNLGREREGSGVVIDSNGLILTIGYLMVEAHSAEVMTNDGQDVPANIGGAALLNHEGKLVGIGSLILADVTGKGDRMAGNMFVPTDLLPPILADLMVSGRTAGAGRPWLGVNTDEMHGHLMISNVTPGGPAEHAGLKRGDIILGVNGEPVTHLPEFYRKLYAQGDAGTVIPLDIFKDNEKHRIEIKSINRLDHLRLKSSF